MCLERGVILGTAVAHSRAEGLRLFRPWTVLTCELYLYVVFVILFVIICLFVIVWCLACIAAPRVRALFRVLVRGGNSHQSGN